MRELLRELREALGRLEGKGKINQAELGARLEPTREISAMQGYERGVDPPDEFLPQFAELARKAGRPILAEQFMAVLAARQGKEAPPVKSSEELIFSELQKIATGVAELLKRLPKQPRSSRES